MFKLQHAIFVYNTPQPSCPTVNCTFRPGGLGFERVIILADIGILADIRPFIFKPISVDTGDMPVMSCIPWSGWYKGNSATAGVMWGSSSTSLLKSVCSSRRSLKMQKQLHRLIPRSRPTLPSCGVATSSCPSTAAMSATRAFRHGNRRARKSR